MARPELAHYRRIPLQPHLELAVVYSGDSYDLLGNILSFDLPFVPKLSAFNR